MKPFSLALILAILASWPVQAQQCSQARGEKGRFDYYVLSLSWSPGFCSSQTGKRDAEQCAPPRRNGFIVHGLWPQYAGGGWPQCCGKVPPLSPSPTLDGAAKVMPSESLRRHEWAKHGSCVTTRQDEYFEMISRAASTYGLGPDPAGLSGQRIALSRLKGYWPNVAPSAMTARCKGSALSELRLCLDTKLSPIPCPASAVNTDSCPGTVTLP